MAASCLVQSFGICLVLSSIITFSWLVWRDEIVPDRLVVKNNFSIDYQANSFRMDGGLFRYVSGSIHYFRVPRALWGDRLSKLKGAGFNAIQFVIPWNIHERHLGQFSFEDDLDVESFLYEAENFGLYALVRIGPYVCAERNGGGLPWWLYQLHPNIRLRSSDPNFLNYTELWWNELLPRLRKHLYINGGNVIMVQLENEYGSFGCDTKYTTFLREQARKHLGPNVQLYTTDGNVADLLKCGKIPGVYATVDFGVGDGNAATSFAAQRSVEPRGPLVNSEFYSGWFDVWGSKHHTGDVYATSKFLDDILSVDHNTNVNVYMAHGGTSFGFETGSNADGKGIAVETTSYDYDALISEAGDLTPKYFGFKVVIAKHLIHQKGPNIPLTERVIKANYGPVRMFHISSIFDAKRLLQKGHPKGVFSEFPLTMEQLNQENGFILYEHTVSQHFRDPSVLRVLEEGVHDRAQVFVNENPQGILSRMESIYELPISLRHGDKLQILVENQGRRGYGSVGFVDFKGLVNNVSVAGYILTDWWMFGLPFDDPNLLQKYAERKYFQIGQPSTFLDGGLMINKSEGQVGLWMGKLKITCNATHPKPETTFMKLPGWTKGVAFINGVNIGRYWPVMGPQITLYVPSVFLRCGHNNTIILFEQQTPGCKKDLGNCWIEFVDQHDIAGPVPLMPQKIQGDALTHSSAFLS